MIKNIIAFLFYLFLAMPGLAQTASLLPQGRIQFFDNNGNPLAGGKVYNYIVGTTTFKTTWQDANETTPNANPIILDSAGRALIYGQGAYRQIVRAANNDLIWDAVTSSTGSGGSSATGDGDLVGTVKPWAGLTAPNQYVFAYGQELSRSTYSSLLTAITLTTNATCTSASNVLSFISDTTSINVGSAVEASCIPSGTTVVSKTVNTVTVSNPATLTIVASAQFFPFGNGNATTTFNVPDLRGYVLAGRDNMGGIAASRLTTTYFGSNTPDALGATGGSQSTTIAQANLPAATLTTTIAAGQGAHTHTNTASTTAPIFASAGSAGGGNGLTTGTATVTVTVNSATLPQMTGTTPLGGSGTAISRIQPSMTMNYIIKVTPDTSSSIVTGVTDIEGMTGSIACGTGLSCTGNIISSTITVPSIQKIFISGIGSSTWNTPANTSISTNFDVYCVGGGGGAGGLDFDAIGQDAGYQIYWTTYIGGGGAGAVAYKQFTGLPPNTTLTFNIGNGGIGGHTSNTIALGNNPFSTTMGSSTVVVTQVGHGFVPNNAASINQPAVLFSGASSVAGFDMNGAWNLLPISLCAAFDADHYCIRKTTTPITDIDDSASSTTTGGGASVILHELGQPGGDTTVSVAGYLAVSALGGGTWENAGYGPGAYCLNTDQDAFGTCYPGGFGSDAMNAYGSTALIASGGSNIMGIGAWSGGAGNPYGGGAGGGTNVSQADPPGGYQGICEINWVQ